MRCRILFAIAVLIVAAFPQAALADDHGSVEWRPLSDAYEKEVPEDGVTGRVELSGRISAARRFSAWRVELAPLAGQEEFGKICEGRVEGVPASSTEIQCSVDTVRDASGRLSANGRYAIRVWVAGGEQEHRVGDDLVIALTNAPAAPKGIRIANDEGSGRVQLQWRPNEEPDLLHYVVEQRMEGQSWTEVARDRLPSYDGPVAESGSYRFRVAAVRPGNAADQVVTSSWNLTNPRKLRAREGAHPAQSGAIPPSTTTTTAASGDGKAVPSQETAPAPAGNNSAEHPGSRPEPGGRPPAPTAATGPAHEGTTGPTPPPAGAGATGFDQLARGGGASTLNLPLETAPARRPATSRPRPPVPVPEPDGGYAPTLPYALPATPASARPSPAVEPAPTGNAAVNVPVAARDEMAAAIRPVAAVWPLRWAAALILVTFALCLLVFALRRLSRACPRRPGPAEAPADLLQSVSTRLAAKNGRRSLERLEEALDLQLELVRLAREVKNLGVRDRTGGESPLPAG